MVSDDAHSGFWSFSSWWPWISSANGQFNLNLRFFTMKHGYAVQVDMRQVEMGMLKWVWNHVLPYILLHI